LAPLDLGKVQLHRQLSVARNLSHKEAQKAQNQQKRFELFVLLCG